MATATSISYDEERIRELTEDWADALRRKDVDGVMKHYTPDIVVFGITPPLHYEGTVEHRKHWERSFAAFDGPIEYVFRDLTIVTSGDVGFGHCLNKLSGTMKGSGDTGGTWMRVTVCYRKVDGEWLVSHEHVSVPLDTVNGKGAVDLTP